MIQAVWRIGNKLLLRTVNQSLCVVLAVVSEVIAGHQ